MTTMDNKQLLQSAKDEAAREYGHVDFDQACAYCFAMNGRTEMISVITNRAMEIYASQQRTEWIKQGFSAARDVESECKVWNCEGNVRKYPTADDYLNSKP